MEELRICILCNESKTLDNFTAKKKHKFKCNTCCYQETRKRERDKKLRAIEYLGGECIKCGYNDYYGALEFHHLNPSEKECDWKRLKHRSWKKIVIELDKCVCLCSNCHKEVHRDLNDGFDPVPTYLTRKQQNVINTKDSACSSIGIEQTVSTR